MLRSRLPNVSAGGAYGKGLFDREMGPLQSQLRHGEYALLKLASMLESDFIQISKRGEVIDVHNQVETVTVGVACTCPNLLIPNVLLLARPIFSPEEGPRKRKSLLHHRTPAKRFELTRLLPLHFVKISVHNAEKKQLRFKLASGRTFYLQLCPQPGVKEDVFALWIKVVNMLRPPTDPRLESHSKVKDLGGYGEAQPQSLESPPESLNLEEGVSIRSVYSVLEAPSCAQEDVRSRRSLALAMGSQPSSRAASTSPAASEGGTPDFDCYVLSEGLGAAEPVDRPPSHKSRGSRKERTRSSPSSSRKTSKSSRASRSSRRKSPRRSPSRKPSKFVSLIRSCSWGSQRKRKSKTREPKTRGHGKKR